ncbi:MAG: hypothetical protein FJY17_00660 [Bacteroidetes bacterium]|nr:hypothetical protein [Bacteroidota bacterium]
MKVKIYREETLERKMYCVYQVIIEYESYIKGFPFELSTEDDAYRAAIRFAKQIEQEGLPDKKELIYETI